MKEEFAQEKISFFNVSIDIKKKKLNCFIKMGVIRLDKMFVFCLYRF